MQNYTFLDFDGVLNHSKYYDTDEFMLHDINYPNEQLSRNTIALLNKFLIKTNSVVVVTSDWRLGTSVEELQSILEKKGFTGRVVGKTKNLSHEFNTCMCRGKEIEQYINEHHIESFVVFDDDTSDLEEVWNNLVIIDGDYGLTQESLDKATKILQNNLA